MEYKLGLNLKCKEDINWTTKKFEKDKYYRIIYIITFGNFSNFVIENPSTYSSGEIFEEKDLEKYFYTDKEIRKQKLEKIYDNSR